MNIDCRSLSLIDGLDRTSRSRLERRVLKAAATTGQELFFIEWMRGWAGAGRVRAGRAEHFKSALLQTSNPCLFDGKAMAASLDDMRVASEEESRGRGHSAL